MEQNSVNESFRCTACQRLIDHREARNHILNCCGRPISNDEQNQHLANHSFQEHTQLDITTDDDNNTTGYQTRSTETFSYFSSFNQIEGSILREMNHSKDKHLKICPLCSQSTPNNHYDHHLVQCLHKNERQSDYFPPNHLSTSSSKNKQEEIRNVESNEDKRCLQCDQWFHSDQYLQHLSTCMLKMSTKNDEDQSVLITSKTASRKVCLICCQLIDPLEFENHVEQCVDQNNSESSNQQEPMTTIRCLDCQKIINKQADLFVEIVCPAHHYHCWSCFRQSMKRCVQQNQIPVCHQQHCDYRLSSYEISMIPMERQFSDRLLKLAQGQQRPLCPKCHFYISLENGQDFDEHIETCHELIPCEFCQLPYSFNQLDEHSQQCQNDQTSLVEKMTNFLYSRIKYPFKKVQIRYFIEQQLKNSSISFDVYSLISDLGSFESIYPYEIPTLDCVLCLESCYYDDIYVSNCSDAHKYCYQCFVRSCETQMNNSQILTCAICKNSLRDGEIGQLRVDRQQLRMFQDYQTRKTFDYYSNETRGILKCPNKSCRWVAEAEDPNERFLVQCRICNHRFCSLCNQQYHYRTKCQQLPQIIQHWLFWCQTERTRYLRVRAEKDVEYASRLTEYHRKCEENENRNRALKHRYDELIQDERYKSEHCRLCPSCCRVVQRVDGCNTMICGRDAHGGNIQSGCGRKFNWTQARPYQQSATFSPQQTTLDLPKPENSLVHHQGVKCDQCENELNGIRFDCVHCPSLTFCEKCEQQATLNHSRENQSHQQVQHVFRLIFTPEDELNLVEF